MFYVDKTKCKGCGLCIENCPQQAISLNNGVACIDQKLCIECGSCREICKNGAIYEIEVMKSNAARTDNSPGEPSPGFGPVMPKENKRGTTVVGALAALALMIVEGLATLTEKWATSGRMQGGRRGRNNRGCRRRRKRWL